MLHRVVRWHVLLVMPYGVRVSTISKQLQGIGAANVQADGAAAEQFVRERMQDNNQGAPSRSSAGS